MPELGLGGGPEEVLPAFDFGVRQLDADHRPVPRTP
jgi:hypothetical protein